MHRQPAVKVQDVLPDLYEFCNKIAHGQEIPKSPYRMTCSMTAATESIDDYHYAELML